MYASYLSFHPVQSWVEEEQVKNIKTYYKPEVRARL